MKKSLMSFLKISEFWILQHIRVKKEGLFFWHDTEVFFTYDYLGEFPVVIYGEKYNRKFSNNKKSFFL